jgi:hypothetical protein
MASLEAVICLGVTVPVAVALYLVAQYTLDQFCFLVGSAVGAPWL